MLAWICGYAERSSSIGRSAALAGGMGGDQDDRRSWRSGGDEVQPVAQPAVFEARAGVPDQHEQRLVGEEELMRRVVDLLAAEVPHRQPHVQTGLMRVGQHQLPDAQPMRGRLVRVVRRPAQRLDQRRLPGATLPHDQHLRPPHPLAVTPACPQERQHRLNPLRHHRRRRTDQSLVALEVERGEVGEVAQRVGQGGELVVGQPQRGEVGEAAQRVGQGGELVVGQVQRGEVGEVAQRVGQGGELVAGQVQRGEVGEVAQRVGQGGELVAGQVQRGEVGEVAQRVGQGGELVAGQVQRGEVGEAAQRVGQGGELVAGQVQRGEVGEVAQPVGQGGELVAGQVQRGEVGEVAEPVGQGGELVDRTG